MMAVATGLGVILAISASRSFAPASVCLASTTMTLVLPMMIVLFPPAPPRPAHTSGFILLFQGAAAGPAGVVTGQLRTLEGSLAIAVRVAAMPVPTGNAVPTDGPQYFVAAPPESTALTDNQGRYRLNIPPGRYY